MIESGVKLVVLFANLALTAAWASAWWIFRSDLSWGAASSVQVHLAAAGVAVMIGLFSNLCVIFYFTGTGVWIKDQAKSYASSNRTLALAIWDRYELASKLKGKTFPMPTMALVFGLFSFILGGANQVGAIPHWLHPTLATLYVIFSWAQISPVWKGIHDNLRLLDESSTLIDDATEAT